MNAKIYKPQGADQLVVDSSGEILVKTGGRIKVESGGIIDDNLEEKTPVNAVAAVLTTALTGDNNDLLFTAKTKSVDGNSISIIYVDPGEAGDIAVGVTDNDIVLTLAYAENAITSTASDIKTAIEANENAAALVTVANAAENTGAGIVTAMAKTNLMGGVDATEANKGAAFFDENYLYVAIDDNTVADTNWRRISLGSVY